MSAMSFQAFHLSKSIFLLFVAGLISACATSPLTPPIVEDSSSAPVEREASQDPDNAAELADSTVAINVLLAQARTASDSDDYPSAVAHLMRGLRIEPRNALIWIQLSAAHLANANVDAASQHAKKAIALAGQDGILVRSAWLQMAEVYEAQGNATEAKAIRRRYRYVRG